MEICQDKYLASNQVDKIEGEGFSPAQIYIKERKLNGENMFRTETPNGVFPFRSYGILSILAASNLSESIVITKPFFTIYS